MSYNTTDIEVMGFIFDLSLRHGLNGKKHLDNVKDSLNEFLKNNIDEDDIMYLSHPEIIEPVNRVGAIVSAISNYSTDGWKFELSTALKQTLFVVAAEPYEQRTVLLITDRLSDERLLKRIATINTKDMLDCKLVCLDIGKNLPEIDFMRVVCAEDSSNLTFKEIIYAKSDFR